MLLSLVLLVLAPPEAAAKIAPPMPPIEACEPNRAKAWIGKKATPANVANIKRVMGSEIIRVLKPDQIMTLEYRFGRSNILVDRNNLITQINCG